MFRPFKILFYFILQLFSSPIFLFPAEAHGEGRTTEGEEIHVSKLFEFEFKEGMNYNIPMVKIFEQAKKSLGCLVKWNINDWIIQTI
jgi:hypothetical protein